MADFKHIIRAFSGGILEDKRQQSPNHFSITKHFDTFTYPGKLVPYPQTIASLGDGSNPVTALGIIKFLYAQHLSSTLYRLYGLGVNGNGNAKIYTFDINAGTPNTTVWVPATNGESNSGALNTDAFFYYKGFIYVYAGGNVIQRYDTLESLSFNTNYQSVSYTGAVAQPVHHPSDDIAYFFDDHNVYTLNNTTWGGAALTLPSNEVITCACPFGNYLAIGTVTAGTLDARSTVYLWDRDSSLTTLSDRIDFGAGTLKYLASLNNKLIGVQNFYLDNLYALNRGRVQIKEASGEFGVTLNEITTDTANVTYPQTSITKEDRLYFPMAAQLNGDSRAGIWAVDENGKIALDTIEYSQTGRIDGIFSIANIWWITHSENGSVTHTDATAAYSTSNPSVWESLILSTVNVTPRGTIIMNAATTKKLIGVTVTTEPLLTNQSVTIKYRADASLNNGAWTTIFTTSTVNSTSHSAVNIESTGANLPTYNEIQFRVESLGGAVFTGMMYGGEVIDNDKY